MDGGPSTSTSTIDMARHGHPSPDHTLMRDPNSPASLQQADVVVGCSSPPPLPQTTKMASSSAVDFWNRGASAPTKTTIKPMTMFYNGGVAVFHLPQDKADELMKMVSGEDGVEGPDGRRPVPRRRANDGEELVAKLREDMPIASKRSLQRFFQKRKERLYRP